MKIGPLFLGWEWVHDGSGYSSHRTALLAAWHSSRSITWRWAVYWARPVPGYWAPEAGRRFGQGVYVAVRIPLVGVLFVETQPSMPYEPGGR